MTGASRAVVAPAGAVRADFQDMLRLLGATPLVTGLQGLEPTLEGAVKAGNPTGVVVSRELQGTLPQLVSLGRQSAGWPEVAISRGRVGVAATGSVAVAEPDYRDRLASLLCLRHVLLLPGDALVASLVELPPYLREWIGHEDRRYVTLVSGPSRTSDIERVLTLGVHGPQELVVVLVDGWNPDGD